MVCNICSWELLFMFFISVLGLPLKSNTGDEIVGYESDMELTEQQLQQINFTQRLTCNFYSPNKRKMLAYQGCKWPRAVIPYEFHSNLSYTLMQQVTDAITEWHRKTCIRFVRMSRFRNVAKILRHSDSVLFYNDLYGCKTTVGRTHRGKQLAGVSENCGQVGNIIHELGHVIGFVHEHSRWDRDEFITILYQNIIFNTIPQFGRYRNGFLQTFGIPYDIGSIMHYRATESSIKDNLNSIVTNDWRLQDWLGQREKLSFLDAKHANYAYRCTDHCDQPHKCNNGGYIGPTCICVCPDGLRGPTCDDVFISETGCGGILTDLRGHIKSPRYPTEYLPNENCYWFIKGPENSTIDLQFNDFKTEHEDCTGSKCDTYDFLEIRVYGTYLVGQRYYGLETGNGLHHNSSTLLLHFVSDLNFGERGFHITYRINP